MMYSNTILTLPEVALEKILCFLTYDEIAKSRLVCRTFNQIGGALLSRGFWQIEKRHNNLHKKMRTQLPRRESERRSHPLARHCDILTAVETRLSMLSMTYLKYMENRVCCFIPGKVLDEIVNILDIVENAEEPPRTPQLLQELRDISSMAMEHFDEIILPRLQDKVEVSNVIHCSTSKLPPNVMLLKQVFADETKTFKRQAKVHKYQTASLSKSIKMLENKLRSQSKLLRKCSMKIYEQAQLLQQQDSKIKEQDSTIAELKRHIEEWDQKQSDLTSELVRSREESTNSIKTPSATPSKPPTVLMSVKPRMPLKFYDIPVMTDIERKRKSPFTSILETPVKMQKSFDNNKIVNIISKNLTSNISKSIVGNYTLRTKDNPMNKNFELIKRGASGFLSSSIEKFVKNPIVSIRSRKRKMSGDIHFE